MRVEQKQSDNIHELILSGRFTFSDFPAFRRLVSDVLEQPVNGYVIDLENVEFIDSAGLGMLLLARDEAVRKGRPVSLRRPQGQVQRVLAVARFGTLFTIQG